MKVTKHQRQHRIAALLESEVVSSQPQLVELLQAHDIDATQATVSRDLVELGAVKVRLPGGVRAFVLPSEPTEQVTPTDHLRRVLNEWVVDVGHSLNLVVVRTPPGCAHVVAAALDRSGHLGMLGTVAGDDTILVIATEAVGGEGLAEELKTLAGIAGTKSATKTSTKE
jgi:transcriptional regulator of arginine metabolism